MRRGEGTGLIEDRNVLCQCRRDRVAGLAKCANAAAAKIEILADNAGSGEMKNSITSG
jgi:hypothetical protein